MNKFLQSIIYLFALFCSAYGEHEQSCSTKTPCVAVNITDNNATTSDTATLYACMGSPTSCSQAALAATIANPSAQSVWKATAPFPQKAATVTYNDQEPYGALMNYAALNTTSGGVQGPVSGIYIFQVPQAPLQAPTVNMSLPVLTTGTVGPQ